jgi:hypothetical protein
MLTQGGNTAATSSLTVDVARGIPEPPRRRTKWCDIRDAAAADPGNWHPLAVCADPGQARNLRRRIRGGIQRWAPAGAWDARITGRTVWIKAVRP